MHTIQFAIVPQYPCQYIIIYYFLLYLIAPTTGAAAAPACYGEHLPYSFNTMHYLSSDGEMNYQSSEWLVPSNFGFATLHDIKFYVNASSMIRVYTEPHAVDIDIKLIDANSLVFPHPLTFHTLQN
jgi:hypothetical protein